MVPLRDNNPITAAPFITYALVGANIFIYLCLLTLAQQQLQQLFYNAAVVPCQLSGTCPNLPTQDLPEWMTLFTSQFLHGGFFHLTGNMLYLWVFGNNVEDRLGHVKYLILYLTCGVLSALAHWFFSKNSTVPYLGSTGVTGLIGAYILHYRRTEILKLILIFFSLLTIMQHWADPYNIVSFITGAILGHLLNLFKL
jgi:membrane associated rhomboid family serine protease